MSGPLKETSSASSHHYELALIASRLADILDLMQTTHDEAKALQDQAKTVLDAHKAKIDEYIQQSEVPVEPDFYPFSSLPAGSNLRELPTGQRLFTLPDGHILRTENDYRITCVQADGTVALVTPGPGRQFKSPDGLTLELHPDFLKRTHAEAGIKGLPNGVSPKQVNTNCHSVELPSGIRVDVHRDEKKIVVALPTGITCIGSLGSVSAIGDQAQSRAYDGSRSFKLQNSSLAGLFSADGVVELSLPDGVDLEITFEADGSGTGTDGESPDLVCGIECRERVV